MIALAGIILFWLFPGLMTLDTKYEFKSAFKDKYGDQFNVIWKANFHIDKIIFTHEHITTELKYNEIWKVVELKEQLVFQVKGDKIFIIPKRNIDNLKKLQEKIGKLVIQ
ncbi:MAG: YcxB family protein [Chitinophagales bacterium]